MVSLECFGGSNTQCGITSFPPKFEDVWSGILEELHDPISDPAKTQDLNITTLIYDDFIKGLG
jgi:hypothetical protein